MNKKIKNNPVLILTAAILLAFYGLLIIRPIDIGTGDLGRHLQNGKVVIESWPDLNSIKPLLNSNFYANTFHDFPFVNHHWASGVIFYLIWLAADFLGLQIFFILISFATFLLFFDAARRQSHLWIATPIALFLLNIVAERREVRPEIFSYLFLGINFFILQKYKQEEINYKWLLILPALALFWVNLHVYFIFGIFVLGIFWLDSVYKKNIKNIKILGAMLLLCVLLSCLNPHGFKALLYPFQITNDFGMVIQEMLPVSLASPRDFSPAKAFTFKFSFLLFIILSAMVIWKEKKDAPLMEIILGAVFGILAWKMLKNMSMYGFFMVPILSLLIYKTTKQIKDKTNFYLIMGIALLFFTLIINRKLLPEARGNVGFGLLPGADEAAYFIKNNHLSGPIFNDFNSGGYVIFYLFPDIKPFIDNRPEAYPSSFLINEYTPMRLGEDIWYEKSEEYGFNTILISLKNRSKESLRFTNQRLNDYRWSEVFRNEHHIIFVRKK